MNRFSFFLAQIDVKDALIPDLQKTAVSRGHLTPLFAALGVVTLLVVVWAIFIRKRPDERSRRYTYPSRESKDRGEAMGERSERRGRRRKRRRPRNRTLAEAGGLPPIRSQDFLEDSQ